MYSLFHAYSAHHREIGYVQGMMSIGGLALMYVAEEDAFWMLEVILNGSYGLRGLYEPERPLAKKLYVLSFVSFLLLRRRLPGFVFVC